MAQKKNRKKSWGFGSDSQTINKSIRECERYILKKQWSKAETTLEELEQRFPSKKEILDCWLALAYEKGDWRTYQIKATEYSVKYPDDPDIYLALSSICLRNAYPLLAVEALQNFKTKFPNHSEIPEVNQKIEELKGIVPKLLLKNYNIEEQQAVEIGTLTEQSRFLFESSQYPEARKVIENLLNLVPNFPPALNNLSLIHCFENDFTGAIALAQQVLESYPNNFQALGNLVRFYLFSGETQLAQQSLNKLKALDNDVLEAWLKKAESLSLFGDWSGLVELGKEAESSEDAEDLNALFWHYVAVGYANLGQTTKAIQLWKKSLKLAPGFEYAQKNLDNIQLPIRDRNTPWAFEVQDWLPAKLKDELQAMASAAASAVENDNQSQSIANRIFNNHPYLINLVPILLKRGSPSARQFAIYMATFTKNPQLLESLKEFTFGQEGTDQERLTVAQELNQLGLIPSGNVNLWIEGEQRELLLMAMEITDEPTVIHSPKVQKLVHEAIVALRMQAAKKAESILMGALKIEPSAPDLQFNLANAYLLQDREEEAFELLRKIHAESPDYAFATITLARNHLNNGELDIAEELLKPLLQKQKFNFQEMSKLCETHIELEVRKKMPQAAISWLNMWKQIADEDDPALAYWSNRLESKSPWLLK